MRIYNLLVLSFVLIFNSCIKQFGYDDLKGSIKELGSNNPIRNQKFSMDYETNKSTDTYYSTTDENGNYNVKHVLYRDVGQYTFKFKNFEYDAKVSSNLYYYFDFYIKEGFMHSNCNLKIKINGSSSIHDTLVLKNGNIKYQYNKELNKKITGPFPSNLVISINDTVNNFCSHKNDGIVERKVYWQFRGKSGTINLTDNYISGVGTIDSLSF